MDDAAWRFPARELLPKPAIAPLLLRRTCLPRLALALALLSPGSVGGGGGCSKRTVERFQVEIPQRRRRRSAVGSTLPAAAEEEEVIQSRHFTPSPGFAHPA
ncbi:hypothetical protein BHM03_00007917 [Ensete ventricosum]|nr:hypothetical protein BHM03_00007917 [Ensete ventricosum]